jgi:hypothetical protein
MSRDEHLNEALYYLRKARFHMQHAECDPGGIDSVSAVLVIVEDAKAAAWKVQLKELARKFVKTLS